MKKAEVELDKILNKRTNKEREKFCGCIITKDNKVLLIKQTKGHWGFPKGHVEKNETEIEIAKDYTKECINDKQENGRIITGSSGVGKTHLAASISNELIEKGMLVLGRLTFLLDMIKDTFKDNSKSESTLIELFSNVDMVVIDDLGTEKISSWALDKLYTIVENRNGNKLPIIITTKFNKESLLHRFYQSNDKKLSEAILQKLYQMCYGIELKRYDQNEK